MNASGTTTPDGQTLKPQILEPKLRKNYSIPLIDISNETHRQVVVAQGTESIYHGHVHTLLMPDGRTIWAVWTYEHGGWCGPMKKSADGGLTWSGLIDVPDNWKTVPNCPTIHRLIAPDGAARLFVFAGDMHQSVSEDEGRTWSPMSPNGLRCAVPPTSVEPVEGGRRHLMWHERFKDDISSRLPVTLWQSASAAGGLTWGETRMVCAVGDRDVSEPACVRSPDGRQLLLLIRYENSDQLRGSSNSLYCTSEDEGRSWSLARELPAALTGHRHTPRHGPDGRLVVVMRDMAAESPTWGSFVAWVGTYDDIISGREGQYRVKLLHQYPNPKEHDCGYGGLEALPDGTFVATTYIKYRPGPEKNSIVSVRFTLEEIDAKAGPHGAIGQKGA